MHKDLVFEEGDIVQLVRTPNGSSLQWVVDGKVIDSWALHLDPYPSPELAKRLLRSWISLMEERHGPCCPVCNSTEEEIHGEEYVGLWPQRCNDRWHDAH